MAAHGCTSLSLRHPAASCGILRRSAEQCAVRRFGIQERSRSRGPQELKNLAPCRRRNRIQLSRFSSFERTGLLQTPNQDPHIKFQHKTASTVTVLETRWLSA